MAARIRLVHPFPSLLNGIATFVLALLAGGDAVAAIRLGVSMTAIQFSIGALNDLVDAPRDGGRRPSKPVADGLVQPSTARLVAVVAASVGLALAAVSGPAALVVAVVGAGCGYAYDLRLSRTAWAWLPLAIALPLVPVFAWLGATGSLPGPLLALVPIGMLAGGGLAVGNSLADLEADRTAGASSIAVQLGRRTAAALHALAMGGATALAVASLPAGASGGAWGAILAGAATLAGGAALLVRRAGRGGRDGSSSRLATLGWQVEAIGTALLGIGWVVALVESGLGVR